MKKKTNPVWGGRFKDKSSSLLEEVNNSIHFDHKLVMEDLKLCLAYSESLLNANIISKKENNIVQKALLEIQSEVYQGKVKFLDEYEDIHMNIEMMLKKKIGKLAGKIHTGKSRNDQVATDMKLWIKGKLKEIINKITMLQRVIIKKSETNISTIMPGFTHSQNAQPISFAHYLMSFFEMIKRDKSRALQLSKNINECPLGSGALAGTNFHEINREKLAKKLGFDKPTENSLDSVSDRDFILEFSFILSLISIHLSRISEDLIIWSSSAYNFVRFPDSLSTGSSIMPQKKNPDSAELIRSKSGRVISSLVNLLIIQKGLPSGYSKDLQEDKEPIFDSFQTVNLLVDVMSEIISKLKINKTIMYDLSLVGHTTATDLADWMVKNLNITFREAHEKTGELVLIAEKNKKNLHELPIGVFKSVDKRINNQIFSFLSPESSVNNKKSYGGTGFEQIKSAIKRAKKSIKNVT
jgi:argininosuccinate lyase